MSLLKWKTRRNRLVIIKDNIQQTKITWLIIKYNENNSIIMVGWLMSMWPLLACDRDCGANFVFTLFEYISKLNCKSFVYLFFCPPHWILGKYTYFPVARVVSCYSSLVLSVRRKFGIFSPNKSVADTGRNINIKHLIGLFFLSGYSLAVH